MLLEGINRIVAPESLAIAHKFRINDDEKEFGIKLAASLEPGDIILVIYKKTQTPVSPIYEILRSIAGSYFDHVGVLLDKESCLQIGPPLAQVIPAYYFLVMNRKPLILRMPQELRKEFLSNAKGVIGKLYNYLKAVNAWVALAFYEKFRVPMKFADTHPEKVICSDAILSAHPRIEELRKKYEKDLDFDKIGSHSLNDFLVLAEKGEFEVIKLPFPFNAIATHELKNYKATAQRLLKKESLFSSIVNLNNILETSRILASTKKKKYRNAYRLVFAIAQLMKMMRMKGVELFHILSFVWPRI